MTLMKEAPLAAADAEVSDGPPVAPSALRTAPLPRDATLAALMASVALAACGGGGDAATENASPPSISDPGSTPPAGSAPHPRQAPTRRRRPRQTHHRQRRHPPHRRPLPRAPVVTPIRRPPPIRKRPAF
ncbi:MAG: hypothetical protein EON49_13000 [Acidovorax sp.]|nr:MAG: hypothetical protein EON49_13000 [Acidovorax sp.]